MLDKPALAGHALPLRRRDGPPPDPGTLPSFRALLAILQRRWRPLLACTLLIPALALVALKRVTPRYTAVGTVIYNPNEYNPPELQSILRTNTVTEAVMASQAEILHGLRLIQPMAQRLDLFEKPEFNPALRPPSLSTRLIGRARALFVSPQLAAPQQPGAPAIDSMRDNVLLAAQRALVVQPLNQSRVLEVSFTAEDPVLAAAAVNILMDIYVKATLAVKYTAGDKAREWLEKRAKELRAEVQNQEDRIAAYRERQGLVRGVHAELDTEQVSQLTEDLARARADLANAEGKLDAARNHAGGPATAAVAPSVVQLRQQLDTLNAQLESLRAHFGPNHPQVVALRREIEQVSGDLAAETAHVVAAGEAEVRAASDRVATLESELASARTHVDRSEQAQIPLNALERDADASRKLLASVLERIQETTQQAAVETPDAHEVSLALPPASPSFPRTGPMLALAMAFGLLFGLFLVYLAEISDTSLRSGEEVRTALGLPCFALIPEVPRRILGRLRIEDYAALKPLAGFTEQIRGLRTGLWLGGVRPRAVAVTAARPSEGKTTVAVALGRVAAMTGERVILLDCDLRRPALARLFGAEGEPGLAECLLGTATVEGVTRKDPLTDMAYIPAGAAGADAAPLFMSEAMARLLQTLRDHYELVLMDAPPALAVTDTRLIAKLADATLFCARWRSTPRDVARNAAELLEEAQANVAGAVLTRVDVRAHGRSGYADAETCQPRYGLYFRD
jgi:polysaccharide biosynthesis transport protein